MIIVDLLGAVGLTAILMYGKPTEPIRKLAKVVRLEGLFKCALCLGFWTGVAYEIVFWEWASGWWIFPFASAAFCWICDALVNSLRETYIK